MVAMTSQFSWLSTINRGFRLQQRRSFSTPRPSLSLPKASLKTESDKIRKRCTIH